jgi:hypothetical protein
MKTKFIKDSSEHPYCCLGTRWPHNGTASCASYLDEECGVFKEYGQMTSECCENGYGSLAVLYCADGVSLTWQQCPSGFECVQRMGITSDKKRALAPYSQCEMTED